MKSIIVISGMSGSGSGSALRHQRLTHGAEGSGKFHERVSGLDAHLVRQLGFGDHLLAASRAKPSLRASGSMLHAVITAKRTPMG